MRGVLTLSQAIPPRKPQGYNGEAGQSRTEYGKLHSAVQQVGREVSRLCRSKSLFQAQFRLSVEHRPEEFGIANLHNDRLHVWRHRYHQSRDIAA